jgi:hypothetical protein
MWCLRTFVFWVSNGSPKPTPVAAWLCFECFQVRFLDMFDLFRRFGEKCLSLRNSNWNCVFVISFDWTYKSARLFYNNVNETIIIIIIIIYIIIIIIIHSFLFVNIIYKIIKSTSILEWPSNWAIAININFNTFKFVSEQTETKKWSSSFVFSFCLQLSTAFISFKWTSQQNLFPNII